MNKREVVWTLKAQFALDRHYAYLHDISPQQAWKVRQEIIRITKSLSEQAEIYQLDEYYPENPGNIRRFFRWSYRIVYQVREQQVVILNIYHTSQAPEE
ncbi:type II toxin-antitoxin system RelE/ParE family toxin [Catalinimonas sp. 4WD22]|uniref:type II toxin-antitoxin system RelE/ParE family toxin n=1 Tax=Catalinimonas locisalis TaxID=3133978 RepID=UPI00310123D2